MKRNIIYSLIAGLSLIISMPVVASQHHVRHGHSYVNRDMPNIEVVRHEVSKLHLTADQKQKIEAVVVNAAPQVRQDVEQMKSNHQQIIEMMRTNYSDSSLNKLTRTQGQLYGDLLRVKLQTIQKIYAVLTPEQVSKLQAMRAKHHKYS